MQLIEEPPCCRRRMGVADAICQHLVVLAGAHPRGHAGGARQAGRSGHQKRRLCAGTVCLREAGLFVCVDVCVCVFESS